MAATAVALVVVFLFFFSTVNFMCMVYGQLYYSKVLQSLGVQSRWDDDVLGQISVCPNWGDIYYALVGTACPILLGSVLVLYYLVGASTTSKKERKQQRLSFKIMTNFFQRGKNHWFGGFSSFSKRGGDVNVFFWSLVTIGFPCLYICYLGVVTKPPTALGLKSSPLREIVAMQVVLAGDAAVLAISFFLIPVAKHSIWLEAIGLDATHALVFHRVAGWISLVFTIAHGLPFCVLYGIQFGVAKEGIGFWNGMWNTLIPPPTCWSMPIVWQDISGSSPPDMEVSSDGGGGGEFPSVIHTSRDCQGYYLNFTGLLSMVGFILLGMTSLSVVRRHWYSLFYNIHIVAGWIMMLGAILHFATVGAVMIPGIIYYIAMSVPVYVQQFATSKKQQQEQRNNSTMNISSPLVQAREIGDSNGCYELEFRVSNAPLQHAFVKLCIPSISSQWHPFSIIPTSQETFRVLFRATGPFTKAMACRVMISDSSADHASTSSTATGTSSCFEESSNNSKNPPNILVDAFYPEGCHWLTQADDHDCLLMVAGGVGIVPFLSFIPSFFEQKRDQHQRRRRQQQNDVDNNRRNIVGETTPLTPNKPQHTLVLHWYCREVALARYVQETYFDEWARQLSKEEQNSNDNASSSFHLQIEIHITSQQPCDHTTSVPSTSSDVEGVNHRVSGLISSVGGPNDGDRVVSFPLHSHAPLETVRWKSDLGGVAQRCIICLVGLGIHWWQYSIVTVGWRHYTAVRIFGLGLTAVVAFAVASVAALIDIWNDKRKSSEPIRQISHKSDMLTTPPPSSPSNVAIRINSGRPKMETVVHAISEAANPGLYLCGPFQLRESAISTVQQKRLATRKRPCAIYDNLSEM